MKSVPTRLVLVLFLAAVLGAGGNYVYKRSGEAGGKAEAAALPATQEPGLSPGE